MKIDGIVGGAMKSWRVRHKMQANCVAADLGVDKTYFCHLENGRKSIMLETLVKWSKIIGCSPDYALGIYAQSQIEVKSRRRDARK